MFYAQRRPAFNDKFRTQLVLEIIYDQHQGEQASERRIFPVENVKKPWLKR